MEIVDSMPDSEVDKSSFKEEQEDEEEENS